MFGASYMMINQLTNRKELVVVIFARNMIEAQAHQLTSEEKNELKAGADKFRSITETTCETPMSVTVRDIYEPHPVIGRVTYFL